MITQGAFPICGSEQLGDCPRLQHMGQAHDMALGGKTNLHQTYAFLFRDFCSLNSLKVSD